MRRIKEFYREIIIKYPWVCSIPSIVVIGMLLMNVLPSVLTRTLGVFGFLELVDEICEHDLRRFGLSPEDVIVDIIGGTKLMSIGATLACKERGVAIEYVPATYGANLNPKRPLNPIEIKL